MDRTDFFHILNPSARHVQMVRATFDKNKSLPCIWVERQSHPTHLETVLNWAMVEGHRKIAIWGGDGTLNRTVQFLYDQQALSQVTLSLFPAGTCNDFYRKIKTEMNINSITVDLGLLEGNNQKRVFINNAGFGRTPQALGQRKSNAVRDIFSLIEKQVQLEWAEEGQIRAREAKILLGIVFNSPYFNCGLHFSKDIQPHDGMLNGFYEKSQNRWRLLCQFIKGRIGVPLSSSSTIECSSKWIKVISSSDFYPQVDGEAAFNEPVTSVTFSVIPQAVKFLFLNQSTELNRS